ncbi:hypothetical protein Q4485_02955 [Granulosicoccaceae sp. 1_MG-2023]|nr:hypothetical protein [Granulosicoccaceae sp. 1_MG-2023]
MSIIERLEADGFELATDGEALEVFPASRLTDDLAREIRERKAEIIRELLAANDNPLTESERQAIARWFDFLGEHRPETRREYLAAAERSPRVRADLLRWAADPARYFRPPS